MEATTNGSGQIDTAAIAAHALESLSQAEVPAPEPSSIPAPEPSSPPVAAETPPSVPSPSEAELLLREAGYISERKPDGREHWIPRSKVLQMIESGLKKRAAAFEKSRTDWETERQTLATDAQHARAWRDMMRGDPRALLQRMAQVDQRFQAFLTPSEPPPSKEEPDPEPQPDVDLGNGRFTYSLQGIRALREWDRRQMERSFDGRLKPLMDRARAEQEYAARARVDEAVRTSVTTQLSRARQWPKFTEYEPQILEALQKDSRESEAKGLPPQLQLHDVYMEVVGPVLAGDHTAPREKVMKELNEAPKSTSVGRTGAEATRNPGPLTTEEIARRAYARLEGR